MADKPLKVVILAAGKSTRMKSDTPKVLHKLAGLPMLQWVLDQAAALNATETIVVIGHEGDRAVVMNGVIDHTHDHIAVLMSKEEAMLQEADIALVEEGVLTPDELASLQARFPDNLFLHA